PPPAPPPFPYTTLFRSLADRAVRVQIVFERSEHCRARLVAFDRAQSASAESRGQRSRAVARTREPLFIVIEWPAIVDVEKIKPQDRKSTRLNSSHDQIS